MRPATRLGLLAGLLLGCTPHTRRHDAGPADSAVRAAAAQWVSAFARHDLDAISAGFADDGVALYPRSAPVRGRAANRAAWAAFFALPNAAHPLTLDTVMVARSGDIAVVQGRYLIEYDSASTPVVLGGQYVSVWQPDTVGRWRITSLTANMYTPPPRLEGRR